MIKTLLTICSFLLPFSVAFCQSEKSDKKNYEIGLNVTTTLAGFFNSGGQELAKDPYLLSFKIIGEKNVFRTGLNFKFDFTDEGLDFGLREVVENEVKLRLGLEWRIPISKHFTLYYGGDVVGSWFFQKSVFNSFPSDLISKEQLYGLGGGPFLGVYVHLHERVTLSTEAYAYGAYYFGDSFTDFGQGLSPNKETISRFAWLPSVPNALYINFRF